MIIKGLFLGEGRFPEFTSFLKKTFKPGVSYKNLVDPRYWDIL
jgi:hypothetical protein